MSIVFPFEEEFSILFGRIKRPIAKVSFYDRKSNSWKSITMIVDSGADYSLLPKYLAEVIDININKDTKKIQTQGVGGGETVYLLKKKIKIRIGEYEREIILGIINSNNIPPLLGRYTFLETFKVVFEKFKTTFS